MALIWGTINFVLLVNLFMQKKRQEIAKNKQNMWKWSLSTKKTENDKICDTICNILYFILELLIVSAVILGLAYEYIMVIYEWYERVFFTSILLVLLDWIKKKNIKISFICKFFIIILTVVFTVVGRSVESKEKLSDVEYIVLALLLAFLVAFYIETARESFVKIISMNKRIPNKGIYKDLYCRTSNIKTDFTETELIKVCEIYFWEYYKKFQKINGLYSIEYVNLLGLYEKMWYQRVVKLVKILVVVTFIVIHIYILSSIWIIVILNLSMLLVFGVIIYIYKRVGESCLSVIAIRFIFDQWGYYLKCDKESGFVGTVQCGDKTKYQKYVHSFLDIAALCRVELLNDKIYNRNRMNLILSNLNDLFLNYTDYKESKNWIQILPLWIASMFEFSYTGEIDEKVKSTLISSVNEKSRNEISIFLQSFWTDMERKKLTDGIIDFVRKFEAKLFA